MLGFQFEPIFTLENSENTLKISPFALVDF